jgi:hypothetical protein
MLLNQLVEGGTMTTNTKPAHKIRSGAIEVAVWRNDGENGPWYSVTMSRSYKKDMEWKQADSFGQDDLLLLAKLLDQAHSWIISQPTTKQQAA